MNRKIKKKSKIKVVAYPSEISKKTFEIETIDLGENFSELSEEEKLSSIQKYLDASESQPYWSVDEIIETD